MVYAVKKNVFYYPQRILTLPILNFPNSFLFIHTDVIFKQVSTHGTNKELAVSYDQNKFYKNVRIKFQGELGLDGFDRFK